MLLVASSNRWHQPCYWFPFTYLLTTNLNNPVGIEGHNRTDSNLHDFIIAGDKDVPHFGSIIKGNNNSLNTVAVFWHPSDDVFELFR